MLTLRCYAVILQLVRRLGTATNIYEGADEHMIHLLGQSDYCEDPAKEKKTVSEIMRQSEVIY